jgi:hypothetical protein
MLVNSRTKDPSDPKGGKLFCLRFRVPFPLFQRLVDMTRDNNNWFTEKKDCAGRFAAPLELKILGVLRVLGRGYCFDGIEEQCFISIGLTYACTTYIIVKCQNVAFFLLI